MPNVKDIRVGKPRSKSKGADPDTLFKVNNAKARDLPTPFAGEGIILEKKTKRGTLQVRQVIRYGRVYAEIRVI